MKLATLKDGTPDGRLVVVSPDLARACDAADIAPSLLQALGAWAACEPRLRARYADLRSGVREGFTFDPQACCAPLPRSFQWCDGSAFLHHGRLMEKAFKHAPRENFETIPLMYQGGSDDFLGPSDDAPFVDEAHGIDFEGEFVVVTDAVPMGCPPARCLDHIVLVGQANDWSLRHLIPREMATGFGFFQSKPSTSFAPVFVTPDELQDQWVGGRVAMDLHVELNGTRFGDPNGREMHFDFGQLVAHAARTRRLGAGTIIGSGTVSNERREAGSACISERRVIEIIDSGAPKTAFMAFGDRVRMEARDSAGRTPFGTIDQQVVRAPR